MLHKAALQKTTKAGSIMENEQHEFGELFQQLGLPADGPAIEHFITTHRPLPASLKMADAPFWNESQRALLRQSISEDANWAVLVDQLSVRLRD